MQQEVNGGSYTIGSEIPTSGGSGEYGPAVIEAGEACGCTICPVCGGCMVDDALKVAQLPGDDTPPPTFFDCEVCSCPKIDISGIENNEKVMCIYQNLVKMALNEYNPLVISFLMNFSDDFSVDPDDIFFNLKPLDGAYGQCDPRIENKYVITLNSNEINNRAPIEIAKTFIHEILHALIKQRVQLNSTIFMQEFAVYIERKTGKEYLNEHALMEDHYVVPMMNFLKDYDKICGRISPDAYYRALAMSGMEKYISDEEYRTLINAQTYFRNLGLNCN